jgi:hypothetical protein
MTKSFTSKLVATAVLAALSSVMLIAPLQASAATLAFSAGHGVKCYYVLVSSDPATGTNVWATVCGKGV